MRALRGHMDRGRPILTPSRAIAVLSTTLALVLFLNKSPPCERKICIEDVEAANATEAASPAVSSTTLDELLPPGDGLPRVIHQSWKTKQLPKRFKNMSETFKVHNPDFKHMLWTDDENEQLMQQHYPWFEFAWRGFPRHIFRVDAVRAMYLHQHGGLYFDLDFWCLRPLGELVPKLTGVVLGYMSDDLSHSHAVPNAFMASEPGQPFWLFFLSRIAHELGRNFNKGPEALTGPEGLYRAVREWKQLCKAQGVAHNITIMDRPTWYINDWSVKDWWNTTQEPQVHCSPEHFDYTRCADSFPNSYTVTLWTHSWEEPPWVKQDKNKTQPTEQGKQLSKAGAWVKQAAEQSRRLSRAKAAEQAAGSVVANAQG